LALQIKRIETDCNLYIVTASYAILPSTTPALLKDKTSITFKLSFTGLEHSCFEMCMVKQRWNKILCFLCI